MLAPNNTSWAGALAFALLLPTAAIAQAPKAVSAPAAIECTPATKT